MSLQGSRMNETETIAPTASAPLARAAFRRAASPATMTIFGAAGDLTKRLITPALYNLALAERLSDGFALTSVDAEYPAADIELAKSGDLLKCDLAILAKKF
jgi:hypothetical protein